MRYKVASFFSGIGGLDAPFTWLDFDIVLTCEIDPYNRQILKQHLPEVRHYADITKIKPEQIGIVDVIIGGFPCQDISNAGKRAGLKGSRSGLYWHLHRIIRQARPRIVVLENVGAVFAPTGDDDSPGSIVTASLAALGYDAVWLPLRASDVGAPHQRERWFCVAYTNRFRRPGAGASHRRAGIQSQRNAALSASRGGLHQQRSAIANGQAVCNAQRPRLSQRRQARQYSMDLQRTAGQVNRLKRSSAVLCGSRPTQSRLGRITYGAAYWLDKAARRDAHAQQWPAPQGDYQHPYEPPRTTQERTHRIARVKALGNAVVPQQALPIALTVRQFLDRWRD